MKIKLLALFFLLSLIHCTRPLLQETVYAGKPEDAGILKIVFPDVTKPSENGLSGIGKYGIGYGVWNRWTIGFFLDEEFFMRQEFNAGETMTFLLPPGEHSMLYRIAFKKFKPFAAKFALNSESYSNAQRKLKFKIEKGKTTELIIVPRENGFRFSWGTNLSSLLILSPLGWPFGFWPVIEQDIALEVKPTAPTVK